MWPGFNYNSITKNKEVIKSHLLMWNCVVAGSPISLDCWGKKTQALLHIAIYSNGGFSPYILLDTVRYVNLSLGRICKSKKEKSYIFSHVLSVWAAYNCICLGLYRKVHRIASTKKRKTTELISIISWNKFHQWAILQANYSQSILGPCKWGRQHYRVVH